MTVHSLFSHPKPSCIRNQHILKSASYYNVSFPLFAERVDTLWGNSYEQIKFSVNSKVRTYCLHMYVCVYRYLHLLWSCVQSRQMVEVNLDAVKHGGPHLQHHPANKSTQEKIVGEEMYRSKDGWKKKIIYDWRYGGEGDNVHMEIIDR